MPVFDASSAECQVYTYKEGLLSPVAHDLRLLVTRFRVEVDAQVTASFDATSLVVDTPLKDDVELRHALGAADKSKIAEQIRQHVLHSELHPIVTFRSTTLAPRADGGFDVAGELTLHGVTRALTARTQQLAGRQVLELTLHQPDFGITPFRAMLGALKIHPDVRVRLTC